MTKKLLKIEPFTLNKKITVPPSKSMAHRFLICSALCEGESVIHNIDLSDDILATAECLRNIGAEIKIDSRTAYVKGINLSDFRSCTLNCVESGSTLRFSIPLCLAVGKRITLTGSERLFSRPLDVYEKICADNGFVFSKGKNSLTVFGNLSAGKYIIQGNLSSQFISGLLFVLPLLDGKSEIEITEPVESSPYIDMTVRALSLFGINISRKENTIFINGNQKYSPAVLSVDGDYSIASVLDAFNFAGGNVELCGLDPDSVQGDRKYKEYFEMLSDGFCEINLSDCPDLAPVLFVVSALNHGAKFTGTHRLRFKESERDKAMKTELEKFGIKAELEENRLTVFASEIKKPSEIICGHNDHRIVMALTLLLSITGGTISDSDAVKKSFPDFFKEILQ